MKLKDFDFRILMFFNYKYQKAQVELLEKRIKEKK